MGHTDKLAEQGQEDRQGLEFVPKEMRVHGWTSMVSGDCHLSTSFDKDQSVGSPAQGGPAAAPAVATHLAVLRDLHLLPLRHLGDVEVTLWDPQREKTTRSIRRKSKPEETRNAF